MQKLDKIAPLIFTHLPEEFGYKIPLKFLENVLRWREAERDRPIYLITNSKGLTTKQFSNLESQLNFKGIELVDITASNFKRSDFPIRLNNTETVKISEYMHNMYNSNFNRIKDKNEEVNFLLELDIFKLLALTVPKDIYSQNGMLLLDLNIEPSKPDLSNTKKLDTIHLTCGIKFGVQVAKDNLIAVDSRGNEILIGIRDLIKEVLQHGDYSSYGTGGQCLMCNSLEKAVVQRYNNLSTAEAWSLVEEGDQEVNFSIPYCDAIQQLQPYDGSFAKDYYSKVELEEIEYEIGQNILSGELPSSPETQNC